MLPAILSELFDRDLERLKNEISAYSDEVYLWSRQGAVQNPPGNLCLHLIGNLSHFIGAQLGNTGYVRQREREFSDTGIPRFELLTALDATRLIINNTLAALKEDDLQADYPLEVFGKPMTTAYFLLHLHSHLNYHLGQINYHRRLIDV